MVDAGTRALVWQRAEGRCEYCQADVALREPIFDFEPSDSIKIRVGAQENQTILARDSGNQQIELPQHLAADTQFLKQFGKLCGRLLVYRPQPQDRKSRLQASQIALEASAQPDACSILTQYRQTNSHTITRMQASIYFLLQRWLAIEVCRKVIGIEQVAVHRGGLSR